MTIAKEFQRPEPGTPTVRAPFLGPHPCPHPNPTAVAQGDISIGICSKEKSHPWEPNYIAQRSTPFKGLARLVKEASLQGLPPRPWVPAVQWGYGKGCLSPLPIWAPEVSVRRL